MAHLTKTTIFEKPLFDRRILASMLEAFLQNKMAKRSRLSEAHQFFEGEDAETQNADTDTTSERVS